MSHNWLDVYREHEDCDDSAAGTLLIARVLENGCYVCAESVVTEQNGTRPIGNMAKVLRVGPLIYGSFGLVALGRLAAGHVRGELAHLPNGQELEHAVDLASQYLLQNCTRILGEHGRELDHFAAVFLGPQHDGFGAYSLKSSKGFAPQEIKGGWWHYPGSVYERAKEVIRDAFKRFPPVRDVEEDIRGTLRVIEAVCQSNISPHIQGVPHGLSCSRDRGIVFHSLPPVGWTACQMCVQLANDVAENCACGGLKACAPDRFQGPAPGVPF